MKRGLTLLMLFCAGAVAARPAEPASAVPDAVVLTQDGRRLHFLSELIGARTAVVDFMYTDCMGLCPLQGRSFAVLGRALGPRLGRDVVLISISISPAADTPARLAAWKSHFSSAPGWSCVTGAPDEIDGLIRALRRGAPGTGAHDGTVVIFAPATGAWATTGGLVGPDEVIRQLGAARSKPPAQG